MASTTPDMHAVLERLEKLEGQNRRLKRGGTVVLIALGALALMGQASQKSRIVEASEFALKDDFGKVVARLHIDRGPELSFYDASGQEKLTLAQSPQGGRLIMKSSPVARFPELQLFLMPEGPALHLIGTKGGHVTLSATSPGSVLSVWDAEGYHAEVGVVGTNMPQTGESHSTSAASLTLFGKNDRVIWSAP